MTLTETYEFLWRVRKQETIIRRKETQRDELRGCLMPGGVSYDRAKVQTAPKDTMADVLAKVADLDNEIEALRVEKARLIMEISDAIEQLSDENEKAVLTEFYIARAPMNRVATSINYSVRRTYDFRKSGVTHLGEMLKGEEVQ